MIDIVPAGWTEWSMGDVMAEFYDGPHATPPASETGAVYLGIKNITDDGRLDLRQVRHIAEADYATWTKRVEPRRPGLYIRSHTSSLCSVAFQISRNTWSTSRTNPTKT